MLFNINHIFLDLSPQARETKAKISKWDYLRLKSFCTVKETINKMKRQPTEWEKIFVTDISNGVNIQNTQRTHKTQHQKNQIKIWAEDPNRHFSKGDIQKANRHMKPCPTSLIIRKRQIKTTMRYDLTPVRMAVIKKTTNNKARMWRKGNPCALLVGM